jgi:hypothetical protein
MSAAARPRRRTAWLLAAAVTLVGLFAMHGLSASHELVTSGATPSAAMTQMSPGSHAAPEHGGGTSEHHGARSQARARGVVCAGAGCCEMSGHGECVARLQPTGVDLPLHALVTTTPISAATGGAGPAAVDAADGSRAPPPPDLTALCVCRT